jgi:predicted nucleic acid-binding Zn ribbon protein
MCGQEFMPTSSKALTCSAKCSNDWQNAKRQQLKEARWELDKKPCAFCGGVIGSDRERGSLFCSPRCKRNASSARRRRRAPLYMRQYLYGIEPEQYTALLESQGGRCAICRTDTPGGKGGWHVDHVHATGAIRGLLCHRCNLGLGYMRDNREVVLAAIAYLHAPTQPT